MKQRPFHETTEGKVANFLHSTWPAYVKQSALTVSQFTATVQILELLTQAYSCILPVVMERNVVAVTVKCTGDNLQEITFYQVVGGFSAKRFLI